MATEMEELSETQKNVFVKITDNDVLSLKTLISQPEFNVEFVDENGMTPLQHAAYKGNKEIVQVLLDQVNIKFIPCWARGIKVNKL
jgi:ankyrin repeat protein